ncbi:NAD-P-binding protein [Lenzites betulinus]|nr:NAD-P-binding protein [Lenzites betulinus]
MSSPRVWFITGSTSGFGRDITELALSKGEKVVATARRPEALASLQAQHPTSHLLVVKLDVNDAAAIAAAFAQALAAFGRVDVVVNNAAWGVIGETEGARDADVRAMFETNFWGAANVSRAALRVFREANPRGAGGRLLQISSMAGFAGGPAWGYYAATKHALEGLTESVVAELDPAWNIKITLIEPGGFLTSGQDKIVWTPEHPAYSNPELPSNKIRQLKDNFPLTGDSKKAAGAFWKIAALEDPPLRVPLGKDSINLLRKKLAFYTADLEKYEYLSEDLEVDK